MAEKDTVQKTAAELNTVQQDAVEKFEDKISKALGTGYDINPATQTDGAALRRESLDEQIKLLTYSNEDLRFYRELPKTPARSTVEQYVIQTSKGRVGHSRFVREPEVATKNQSALGKKRVNMKFLSDTRQLTIASQIVDNIAGPEQIETEAALTVLMKSIEWAAFHGDADLSDDPTPDSGVEFDGLAKLIAKENQIDARGKVLDIAMLNHAAVMVAKGYGTPTHAYMPIGVHSQFVNQFQGNQRQIIRDNSAGDAEIGFGIDKFRSSRGPIALQGSTVMENDNILDEVKIQDPTAPLPAKVDSEVDTEANAKFTEEDIALGLEYKVVVSGDDAESRATATEVVAISDATDGVKLTITPNGLMGQRPQFVNIYRKGHETGEFFLIDRVAMHKANEEGVIEYTDVNNTMPETADVFVGEMSQAVLSLYELLPMIKINLGRMTATDTFTILWYGSLALKAPKRWVRIKNVRYTAVANVHGTGFER